MKGCVASMCLVLICAGRAFAQAPDTVLLEELTWTELRELIGSKTTTILDDDSTLRVNDASQAEGNSGTTNMPFIPIAIVRTLGGSRRALIWTRTRRAIFMSYIPRANSLRPAATMVEVVVVIVVIIDIIIIVIDWASRRRRNEIEYLWIRVKVQGRERLAHLDNR